MGSATPFLCPADQSSPNRHSRVRAAKVRQPVASCPRRACIASHRPASWEKESCIPALTASGTPQAITRVSWDSPEA